MSDTPDTWRSAFEFLILKAGGFAAVLDALSGDLGTVVDVTIVYSKPGADFWDFLTGKVAWVLAEVDVIEIPVELRRGDYAAEEVYREKVQTWVRELWERKNLRVSALTAEVAERHTLRG